MARSPHPCPYPECPASVPQHQFACRAHWYLLPRRLRDDISLSYRRDAAAHAEAMADAVTFYVEHAGSRPGRLPDMPRTKRPPRIEFRERRPQPGIFDYNDPPDPDEGY